ncbi:unnamed protein product [Cylicocyclus nassatus]|uniref:Uncharacterized protein n=1 Tax=Cylicocyclus nassatus TaxID=53992 RepID=A0AA36DMP9_CYLNA|nr:unnamed protein product [Cylicocyclus nassatus]
MFDKDCIQQYYGFVSHWTTAYNRQEENFVAIPLRTVRFSNLVTQKLRLSFWLSTFSMPRLCRSRNRHFELSSK